MPEGSATTAGELGQSALLPEEIWRREQCRALSAALPIVQLIHAAAAIVLAAAMWGVVPAALILGWLAGFAAVAAGAMGLWLLLRRAARSGSNSTALLRRFRAAGLVQGLLWALGIFLLFVPGDPVHQGFLALTIAGVAGSAAVAQSSDRVTTLLTITTPLAVLCLMLIREDAVHSFAMSAMSLVYLGFLAITAMRSEHHLRMLMAYRSDVGLRSRQLAASESRLHHLLSAGPAVVFSCAASREAPLTYVSPNLTAQFGHDPADLLGKTDRWLRLVHPEDAAAARVAIATCIAQGAVTVEYRFRHKDDGWRWILDERVVTRDGTGTFREIVGAWSDITARKTVEADLRKSQERLMDAQRIGRIGHWTADLATGAVEWSDMLYEIYGHDRSFGPTIAAYFESIVLPVDLPLVQRALEEVLATGRRVSLDHRIRRGDGSEGWVHLEGVPEAASDGRPTKLRGTAQDITARKSAELALQQLNAELEKRVAERTRELTASEKRLKRAHHIARLASWEYDLATPQWHWSEEFYELFGLDRAVPMTLETWLAMVHPEDRAWVPEALRRARETHRPGEFQYRIVRPDGETRVIHAWGEEVDGKRIGLVMDVTDQVRTERGLAAAQRIASIGSWEWLPGTDRLRWSQEGLRIFGFEDSAVEQSAEAWLARVHPEDLARVRATLDKHGRRSGQLDLTYRIIRPDGAVRTIQERIESTLDDKGALLQDAGTFRDITESRQIELAMQALSHDLIALDGSRYYEAAVHSLRKLLGLDAAFINRLEAERPDQMALLAVSGEAILDNPGFYDLQGTPSAEVLTGKAILLLSGAWSRYPADPHLAEPRIEAYAAEPIRDHTGRIIGLVGVLSRRPLQEPGALPTILPMFAVAIGAAMGREQIHRRDAWLRAILQNAPADITIKDLDLRIMASSGGVESEPEERRRDKIGKRTRDLFPPEIAETYEAADRKVLATGKPVQQEVVEQAYGRARIIQNVKFPMRDETGGIIGVCSISTDVTELRQTAEKLAQAQKMEALGTLTGGIAHDFNNYLAVILGNLDLLDDYLAQDPKAHELIGAALHGAIRSQELTRSLLAFARHQPLAPKIVDVGDAIRDTSRLLERTLGEDIAVTLEIAPDLWPVLVDLAQLASCIVNLAKNARDAMAQGGRLTISAANQRVDGAADQQGLDVKHGDYVMIEVADTGAGIAPELLTNVFEPFFTTKPAGHGTGLGLSMVYGFVTQSGGDIKIRSQPGHGTQVRLYLPRAQLAAAAQMQTMPEQDLPGGSETILLVEDNRAVRQTVAAQLKSLGYQVVEAASGDQAAVLLERDDLPIALILSDVVMAGKLDGYGLARHARARRPQVKVLLMSGFPGEHWADSTAGEPAIRLLAKPYRQAELARALRDLLDPAQPVAAARAV
jgi:PAS domain S-box-containing protein